MDAPPLEPAVKEIDAMVLPGVADNDVGAAGTVGVGNAPAIDAELTVKPTINANTASSATR